MLCAMASVFAQGALDALNYSRMYTNGTARFNAMGGAFGALGDEGVMVEFPAVLL